MNLRFLRTFVAIADNGGFARAAVRLNLTQSAASRQIQALEDELGLRLFARIGRNVQLTPEGEDLLVRSRRLLFDAEAIGQRASALKTGNVGVLRVGATPQVIENLLADFLSRYRKRHAGVEVHLVEDGGSRLAGHLDRGDIDVAQMPAGEDRFYMAIQRRRLTRSTPASPPTCLASLVRRWTTSSAQPSAKSGSISVTHDEEILYTTPEASLFTGLGVNLLSNRARLGNLPAKKDGSRDPISDHDLVLVGLLPPRHRR